MNPAIIRNIGSVVFKKDDEVEDSSCSKRLAAVPLVVLLS